MASDISIRAKAELERRKRRAQQEERRLHYQQFPEDYMVERLKVPREAIQWSLNPGYENYKWDGTKDPILTIMKSLAESKWVGVESGTGTGKTFIGAHIVCWFLECFPGSMVVTTAPKEKQLQLHLWRELGRIHGKFGRGELLKLKLRMKKGEDDWLAVGFVAGVGSSEDSATKAQGFHAKDMLIILEETPGIPEPVIAAFQNTSVAEHNLILAFGNPDHQLDNLHKFCSLGNVVPVRISGKDHPNVVTNNPNFIPGAQSREGLKRMLEKYHSPENPLYMSRARGISPAQSMDSLIRLEWCYAARDRREKYEDEDLKGKVFVVESKVEGDRALGVDVANSEFGDKAAIAEGKGVVLFKVEDFQCPDSNQLGKRDVYQRMRDKKIEAHRVGIDGVGVGAGTVNALKEMGQKVVSLGGSDKPHWSKLEEEFNNLRSQMYWQLREDLRNNVICLPDDEELFADLVTPKWEARNGKIVVESKEDIKKRLGHSPNKGDAVVYWNWIRQQKKKSGGISGGISY
ncbi:MAG TPA: hypothetical protein VHO03_17255 [Ignavibacteriales bacterium]|nr:hypothetical protein [Ignavibacteriales bacterium]